jgi:hypothetical protein
LHVTAQAPPAQRGLPLAGVGHGAHAAPHWVTLSSSTQAPPQKW